MTYQNHASFIPTKGLSLGLAGPRVAVRQRLTIARIQEVVAEFYDIPLQGMTGKTRCRHITRPRQVAMYLARTSLHYTHPDGRKLPLKSLPDIGARFGGRDHTTVIHAVRTVSGLMERDCEFETEVNAIRARLCA